MKLTAFSARQLKWLLLTLVLACSYLVWSRITAPQGVQRVQFEPANESCSAAGRMKYCIFRAHAGTNRDIVYYLHGRKLDEHVWNDDTYWTALVQTDWQRSKALPPTVVTISYGLTWLLTPKGKQDESGLLDDFMARIPEIESKIGSPRRRILLGESMGGLNVLIAGLTHHESFAKVAALCPGVYDISPFAPLSEMRDVLQRTGADPKIGFGVWMLARTYIADDAEWKRISPIALIGQAKGSYPALYLSNGLYDSYGNFEGTQRLAAVAAEKGIPIEWHPLYGGHCAIDTSSLARFLTS